MVYLLNGSWGLIKAMQESGITVQAITELTDTINSTDSVIVFVSEISDLDFLLNLQCDRKIALCREGVLEGPDKVSLAATLRLQSIECYYPYHPVNIPHLFDRAKHFLEIDEAPVQEKAKQSVRVDTSPKEIKLNLPLPNIKVKFWRGGSDSVSADPLILPFGFIAFSGPHFVDTQELVNTLATTLAARGVRVTIAVATLWDAENDGSSIEEWSANNYASETGESGIAWHWPGTPFADDSVLTDIQEDQAEKWLDHVLNSGGQLFIAICGNPFTDPLSRVAWTRAKKHVWVALSRYAVGVISCWDRVQIRTGGIAPMVFIKEKPFSNAQTFTWHEKWAYTDSLRFLKSI